MNENNLMPERAPNMIEKLKHEQANLLLRVKAAAELSPKDRGYYAGEPANPDELGTMLPKCITLQTLKIEKDKTLSDDLIKFLDDLSKLSANPGSTENYLWICDTVISWENRLSAMLNISHTVPLSNPPADLLPRLARGNALSEDELDLRVTSLARVVYAYRIRKDHRSDDDRKDEDWNKAEVFLALDILNGTINFAGRISSDSYPRLEKIWLAQVRELIAYLGWERNGGVIGDPHTSEHYVKAWTDLKMRLLEPTIKATVSEFGEAKRYLEKNYVIQVGTHYKIDHNKLNKAGYLNIIQIKSNRIREVAGQWDSDRNWDNDRNWFDAETYVKLYYENIIPAVMGDTESAQKVIDAFDYSMKSGTGSFYRGAHRIINVFEMALAIYFLSIETLNKISLPGD